MCLESVYLDEVSKENLRLSALDSDFTIVKFLKLDFFRDLQFLIFRTSQFFQLS